ncbi:hypothetical protein K439DRAFT_1662668 [Ramaria rubella]|nr:hypothetical protein K439DRAFT_1662668 [Ramaria rubella]
MICLVQAAMSYASAPMASTSSFIFVLHIFLVLRAAVKHGPLVPTRWPKLGLAASLFTPYLVYLIIFSIVMIYGETNPHQVQRLTFYCHIGNRGLAAIPPGVSFIVTAASVVVEIMIAVTLYRNWQTFRSGGGAAHGLSLHLLIRALAFTLCAVFALLTCAALLAQLNSPAPAIVIACLPMSAFVLFGTQADLLHAWRARIYRKEEECNDEKNLQLSSTEVLNPASPV